MTDITSCSESCPRRKRSWRRFSLRALLLAVLAASIFCGWVAYRVRQFHEQAAFIADLRSQGFRIETVPALHDWFWRPLVGDDAMQVRSADLSASIPETARSRGPAVKDLWRIRAWTNVESLQLYGPTANDETMAVVGTFRKLQTLRLPDTAVTGAGLLHLERLEKLAHLSISCYFQDRFCGCSSLSDGLVRLIGQHRAFMNIRLLGIPVREDVLRQIGIECSELKGLDLEKCAISDDGLRHLQRLTGLRSLGLAGNPGITDRSIEHLQRLRSLSTLVVSQTSMSQAGVEHLRKRLPTTNVVAYDLVKPRGDTRTSNAQLTVLQ